MANKKKQEKKKRFYKKGQFIWSLELKKEVEVKSVNRGDLTITVLERVGKNTVEHTFPLWSVDVLKYKAREQLANKAKVKNNTLPTVYFAKVRDSAIIPSKRDEDAGFDIYVNVEGKEYDGNPNLVHKIYCPAFKTTLVPTGIAMALPKTHYFNVKHERGSTGKISLSVLAGVVDSGYRGEIFVALTPLYKDVLITSEAEEVEELNDIILYPYSKAIAQGTIDLVPQVNIEVIDINALAEIESERGTTKLGQSGK